ncbi:hypothetical protein [Nocardia sp. NPDC050710]|uniref:nSTAND1 domain-containing NTPase n=1 Tax=Nocardia sp. NPDC050710 TaxID=3157220 RepID=UPI0033C698F0
MDSSPTEPRWRPSPRTVFSRQFAALFEAAGNPTLRRVAAAAEARMRATRAPGQKAGASMQRISDWKAGRNVPARFESFLPVLLTLTDEARKSSKPVPSALLDVEEWQRLWTASNEWDPESEGAECPYLGLTSYDGQDAELFFGRTRPTAELAELVRATVGSEGHGGIVMLVGASGAGKSSLLEAGLIPELADPVGEWVVSALTPGTDPVRALVAAIGECGTEPVVAQQQSPNLGLFAQVGHAGLETIEGKEFEPIDGAHLDPGSEVEPSAETESSTGEPIEVERVRARLAGWGMGRRRLLIVDQFEELFTLCRDERQREVFLAALEHIAIRGEREPAAVVIAVRADFYATCLDVPVLEDALKHRSYVLGPMRLDELAEAISRPAELAGYKLEPGLEELVISELCGLGGRGRRHGYDPGALPLVSHVMAAVWQRRDGMRLTIDGYRQAGGVLGSVAATAEQAWLELTEFQQSVGKQVVLELVTVGADSRDTRRKVARAELIRQTVEAAEAALEALARYRLITLDAESAYLTHEIVLDAWPRLRSWIDEDRVGYLERQRLRADASEWLLEDRDPSLLYRGARLTTMRGHADNGPVGPVEDEFLSAADSARRRTHRLIGAGIAALALLGVVSLVLAGVAFVQSGSAKVQRDNAIFAAVLAEADRLEHSDPSLSAQLVLVADRLRPGDSEVRARLVNTQTLPLTTPLPGQLHSNSGLSFRAGGGLLVSAEADGIIRTWDVADIRHPKQLWQSAPGEVAPGTDVTVDPTGSTFVTRADNGFRLWSLRDPAHPTPIGSTTIPGGDPWPALFGPDGRVLVVNGPNNRPVFWNVADPERPTLLGEPIPATSRAFEVVFVSPDLRSAVSSTSSSVDVQLWRIDDPGLPAVPVASFPAAPLSLAFGPDSRTLVVQQRADSTLQMWDVRDPLAPRKTGQPFGAVSGYSASALMFSRDGQTLAVRSGDSAVTVWDLTDPRSPAPLGRPIAGGIGAVTATAFAPDGRTLAVGWSDGTVRLWSTVHKGFAALGYPKFDARGTRMVAVNSDGALELWAAEDSRALRRLTTLDQGMGWTTPVISPDGRTVIARRSGGLAKIYDVSNLASVPPPTEWSDADLGHVTDETFTPDSRYLVAVEWLEVNGGFRAGGRLRVWDFADRTRPRPVDDWIPSGAESVWSIAFRQDDAVLVLGTGTAISTWDMSEAGRPKLLGRTPPGRTGGAEVVAVSPDGRMVAASGSAQQITVWDIADPAHPKPVGDPLPGHTSAVGALAFTPDGHSLVSVSEFQVRLWDFADRQHPRPIRHPMIAGQAGSAPAYATTTSFHPSGTYLVARASDHLMRLWDLDPRHAADRICELTTGTMTRGVWSEHVPNLDYDPPCAATD